MSRSSDIGPAYSKVSARAEDRSHPQPPANWREALMALIAARIALVELELKDLAKAGARCASQIAAACGCFIFGWALLLAGAIPFISEMIGWPWNRVALAAAALHLLVGIILTRLAKPSGESSFPVTRAEFQKDREWIENYQKTRKSND